MTEMTSRLPVELGEPAPDFALPAVDREGIVSLADYRGRTSLLVALFRGLYCPFCRRSVVQLGLVRDKLRAAGVDALGIVGTTPENARRYFRFRPTRLPLAADPQLATHRAYGAPRPPVTPQLLEDLRTVRANPTGELPAPLPIMEVVPALDRLDGFTPTDTDHQDETSQFPQLEGQFLIDRDGIVRWRNIEGARDGLAGLGRFPGEAELLAAAQAVAG